MENYGIIILLLLVCFIFLYLFSRQKKKYRELKNLQDTEIKKRFEEENKTFIENYRIIQDKKNREIGQLEEIKQRVQQEINEKQNFNNSLFKVREEELNRLIEEKRKEKEQAMLLLLEKEQKEKIE